ncbi:pirin family protein [Ferrimonas kyonanensis]|uniref:pirin family protein n=1 Tax=Ferrimonas kyonanensis TaxID=364763 RepID=UPI0004298F3B|nr:pirin family protein [Ferrimonas kyonanensis]
MTIRPLIHIEASRPTQDGDGVTIQRIAGFKNPLMDPFLMLDELKGDQSRDYVGGFPSHPHRGIETLTYMRSGHFLHQDHLGNRGELTDGGAQWMSAGRGVIHSEMPIMTQGQLHGFQLWLNLPAKKKMQAADYQDFQKETIPDIELTQGSSMRLISGTYSGQRGPLVRQAVPMLIADLSLNGEQQLSIPSTMQVMAYLYQGSVTTDKRSVGAGHMLYFGEGNTVQLSTDEDARLLLLAGEPIREPIVHWGPFVMNSQQQIDTAIRQYQQGTLTD